MLNLKGVKKDYLTGGAKVEALRGVDICFRKSEFVSVLGPSGCGKTTLLNIIGGLDKYSDGDLVIKGKSTKQYSDREWDAYRNHSVGFVFQNYNLIPHQSVLANVELALTLSGVKRAERRARAKKALERVGLGDQLHKKPNQMSGGQMQRVAIARAIVNDPEILLADEPTGALDTETSVQVMEVLKEISKDRLVIMVTHNPELAERYSTRIIKLVDGRVTDDSDPYTETEQESNYKLKKNRSMSFLTALGLSVNNLLTKKGRTVMTCFAGSIGIIGIALILAVSNGVNAFIGKVQEDTLSKYPLTIQAEQADLSIMLEGMSGSNPSSGTVSNREDNKVYGSNMMYKVMTMMTSVPTTKNNITDLKKYIESNPDFNKYASAIKYSYNIPMSFYTKNDEDKVVKVDGEKVMLDMYESMGVSMGSGSTSSAMISSYSSMLNIWEEMLSGSDGELVNPMLKEQYDVVYGNWPENESEVVLVLTENNEINDFVIYALGLKPSTELDDMMQAAIKGEQYILDDKGWSYEDLCGLELKLIIPTDALQKQPNGSYLDLTSTDAGLNILYGNEDLHTDIKISGIIRPNENALFAMLGGSIGYTSALTEKIIKATAESDIVKAQLADPKTDVITGLPFASSVAKLDDAEKITAVKDYFASAETKRKAEIYTSILTTPTEEYINSALSAYMQNITREQIIESMVLAYSQSMGTDDTETIKSYLNGMSDDELKRLFTEQVTALLKKQYADQVMTQLAPLTEEQRAAALDAMKFTDEQYVSFYTEYLPSSVSKSTYEEIIKKLGYVDIDSPSTVTIYAATFNDKNAISDLIDKYNDSRDDDNKIKVTDYVKLLMSSVSTVINAISYVLIAFVGISLVVSSIMIGVITNISVLERTKEIGILRAVGASKKDVGHVFNAETFIIGLMSGMIGIGVTLLMIIPINILLHYFTGIPYLSAVLPVKGAVILVVLSMFLTTVAGLIPSRSASKKDPVVALRTE